MVLEYCREPGLGCIIVHKSRVVETLGSVDKKKTLAFAVHESHCYFYSSARACRALAHRREVEYEKLRRECKSSTTPSFDEWKPWAQQLEPGHFFVDTEELPGVRAWFLAGG